MAQTGDGDSTVDNGEYDTRNGRRNFNRHTPQQIRRLEGFFKLCPHPDERQRRMLGMELRLEPRQIKFWFQNKRTQTKAQCERAANDALRSENDKMRCEIEAMRVALKDVMCPSCGGTSVQEGLKQDLQKREQEYAKLKMEYDRLCTIMVKLMGQPLPETTFSNLHDPNLSGKESGTPAIGVDSSIGNINAENLGTDNQINVNAGLKKSPLAEIAASAMDELIKLLRAEQPLWVKSSANEQYVLDEDYYRKNISQYSGCRYHVPRMESSRGSGIVAIDARSLVELYVNPDVWAGIFPSIVYNARTMDVVEAGLLGNTSGSLQLIYEKMHILTPLVQPREFCVLRYCQQIQNGIWIIADVSCDYLTSNSRDFSTYCWKYPSGSMIHELPNGFSKVTCIEHVEVNGNFQVHPLYEDLVKSAMGFGARRWITTLQRAVERYSFIFLGPEPKTGGRRSIIKLASRMVKSYCSIFDLLRSSELMNAEVQISSHKSSGPGQPVGIIFSAATSFLVPASVQIVSSYLSNPVLRSQWDVLCNGNPAHEVIRIPTGNLLENCITVLQPLESSERMMLLQESSVDHLGSYLVYAPFDEVTIREVANGLDSSSIPVLACGFTVTSNGVDPTDVPSSSTTVPASGGSVLTVAFQFLGSDSLSAEDLGADIITRAEGFVTRIGNVVKSAFSGSV